MFSESDKSDKTKLKKMFTFSNHLKVTWESDCNVFVVKQFKSVESKHEDLDNKMERSRISFEFLSVKK